MEFGNVHKLDQLNLRSLDDNLLVLVLPSQPGLVDLKGARILK